jgi:hypothetical protein
MKLLRAEDYLDPYGTALYRIKHSERMYPYKIRGWENKLYAKDFPQTIICHKKEMKETGND